MKEVFAEVNKGPGHEDMNFDINRPMDTMNTIQVG